MNHIRLFPMAIFVAFSLVSCSNGEKKGGNPLLSDFNTPHQTPPFEEIKREHYVPAIDSAITNARSEMDAIINNPDSPTFENTIEAMDRAGSKLTTISTILFNLNYAETDSTLQKIVREVAPKLTDYSNDIRLNPILFERVKTVWNERENYQLTPEQSTLLEKTYKGFVRSGANLNEEQKEKYREITRELSQLSLQFSENVLAETNAFTLQITKDEDLAGLPKSLIDAAAFTAKQKGMEGWVFTLDYPMFGPFMKYSERRELREKMYRAYGSRCLKNNEYNNTELIKRIVNLELELVNILGYKSYADFVLEERMAESAEKVNSFLDELLTASLPFAKKDLEEVTEMAKSLGFNEPLQKWDWAFYSEKLKNKKFNFNEEELKPYFQLEKVKEGVFALATKLYGITFKPIKNIQVYHPDVETYEVIDKDGSFLAILYLDFFPREGKSSGAWMTNFREQQVIDGKDIRPLVSIVTNFTKPTEDAPSLLTFDEFNTFLHEFGHALHGIFSKVNYSGLSGTSVYRDFVELPSQVMENWAVEKEYLDMFAVHYQTGEKIPEEMVQAIVNSQNFISGSLSIRQLSLGMVDMAWYSIEKPFTGDVNAFEKKHMAKADVMPPVDNSLTSTSFTHIFGGGYAAGYYSYKWAEVLDADAYSVFKKEGIFNTDVANSFRENILSKGGSEHPMTIYKRFRGQEPTIDALLERSGLKQ
ncbi:MAG TPA: M3 family metallopeptidase [Tenuifilaceae bacterium]|nr:M3 family metallopeptidase [Tenuifilaceae bacterium]HPE17958.1 M3 family metallopeptidase [Tenuifilaceae bacterium]HPJ44920.1 M3 family metallopeptidase [Tenuifilaceae bacterium]HPQ33114.1 M3 family metallopeptidase [Tenuifilaceae bacterium]